MMTSPVVRPEFRPLYGWSEPQRAHLQTRLRQALDAWQSAWGIQAIDLASIRVQGFSGVTHHPANWLQLGDDVAGDRQVWLYRPTDWLQQLQTLLFGAAPAPSLRAASPNELADSGSIACEIAHIADQDGLKKLQQVCTRGEVLDTPYSRGEINSNKAAAPQTVPVVRQAATTQDQLIAPQLYQRPTAEQLRCMDEHYSRTWSGALECHFVCHGAACHLVLGAQRVAALVEGAAVPTKKTSAGAKTKLVPLQQVLAQHTLALSAQLNGVEIDLGSLQTLQIGDVVRLTHALDEPLKVYSAAGQLLCNADLGARQGRRALELVRSFF